MNFIKTPFPGVIIIEPSVFEDERGYFFESFNQKNFEENGITGYNFVQDNQSKSRFGVIRGLHYQLEPYAQAKLVRALSGKIYDVCVDLRYNSPTFGKWFGIELSAENKLQIHIPRGFAHGYSVLSQYAEVFYKCDNFYNSQSERGIIFNDKILQIDWKIDVQKAIISKKDLKNPPFEEAEMNFYY